MPAIQIIPGIP